MKVKKVRTSRKNKKKRMEGKYMATKQIHRQKRGRRTGGKIVAVRTSSGIVLRKRMHNGEMSYTVSRHPSHRERREDSALQTAVFKKTQQQLASGIPVARYDATRCSVCLEYPDGHIEYT